LIARRGERNGNRSAGRSIHTYAGRESRFVKVLVIEIFSSVLGLFGLIIGLLVSGKAADFK
jgi:F0F1-type ATP synthase membrane subunit c/vacuolar-type H+-ATPase subunit K